MTNLDIVGSVGEFGRLRQLS